MPEAGKARISGTGEVRGPDGKVKQRFTLSGEMPVEQAQAMGLKEQSEDCDDGSDTRS